MKERDKWDDIIRAKLESFEAETAAGDWDTIATRLPAETKMTPVWGWRYAAAIAAMFLMLAGGYYIFLRPSQSQSESQVADIQTVNEVGESRGDIAAENPVAENLVAESIPAHQPATRSYTPPASRTTHVNETAQILAEQGQEQNQEQFAVTDENNAETQSDEALTDEPEHISPQNNDAPMLPDAKPLIADAAQTMPARRWGFGMGGGSYSVGNTGAGSVIGPDIAYADAPNMDSDRMISGAANEIKQNVNHRRPISFGLGVGYALTDRWTLQSGIVYSLLISDWDVLAVNRGRANQQLHFIGVPLGVNYRIAEWRRFRFYTAVGGTAEWNVGGRIKTDYYNDAGLHQLTPYIETNTESVRMKETQFSVNGRVGVSYPLLHFLSAYAEGGADYYFKTKSSLETIRSDKPFQLSLQAGLRFGF